MAGRGQREADRGAGIEGVGVGQQIEIAGLLNGRHIDTRAVAGTESADTFTRGVVLRQAVRLVTKPEISTIRITEERIHDNSRAQPMVMRPSSVVVDGQVVRMNHFLTGSSVAHEEAILEQSVITSPVVVHRAPVNGAVAGVVADEAAMPRSDIGGPVVDHRTKGKRAVFEEKTILVVDLSVTQLDLQSSAVILVTGSIHFLQLVGQEAVFPDVGNQLGLERVVVAHESAVPHLDQAETSATGSVGPDVVLVTRKLAILDHHIATGATKHGRRAVAPGNSNCLGQQMSAVVRGDTSAIGAGEFQAFDLSTLGRVGTDGCSVVNEDFAVTDQLDVMLGRQVEILGISSPTHQNRVSLGRLVDSSLDVSTRRDGNDRSLQVGTNRQAGDDESKQELLHDVSFRWFAILLAFFVFDHHLLRFFNLYNSLTCFQRTSTFSKFP